MRNYPPFPVDDMSLDLLYAAVRPDPAAADRSSFGEVSRMFAELAGMPAGSGYHHCDVIGALIDEVRRLRAIGCC